MPIIGAKGSPSSGGFGQFAQSGAVNYIEDVFSTYVYTGNGSALTITNGIDLSTKGGLVWIKSRSNAFNNQLFDTLRGTERALASNNTDASTYTPYTVTAFNNSGFTLDGGTTVNWNTSTTYASWTFRKQPKFFDVVTYAGTGEPIPIQHNLGSVPGCILVKRTDTSGNSWCVYHRGANGGVNPQNYQAYLNTTGGFFLEGTWSFTAPTSTQFYVNPYSADTNVAGATYVAYLFAHNAGGFGLTGTDNVISCGSFTTNGTGNFTDVNLGYEPQWILVKRSSAVDDWFLIDNMRGWTTKAGNNQILRANTSASENASNIVSITSTGFGPHSDYAVEPSSTYIYIAIRRGPMKVPTSGTSVFAPVSQTGGTTTITTGFPVDLSLNRSSSEITSMYAMDRLRGGTTNTFNYLRTALTNAETTGSGLGVGFQNNTGLNTVNWWSSVTAIWYNFRRAPSFFDEVCYTGDGNLFAQVTHGLTVTPQLIIGKSRSATGNWAVWSYGAGVYNQDITGLSLNSSNAALYLSAGASTFVTSTYFSPGFVNPHTGGSINDSGVTYVAYLFATCAGVSKVGSYTGTGTTLQVNCSFTTGARFVLIKRVDSTGDWYVWDSARGIVAGNDPYLLLNSTAAEVTGTDYIDTYSAGFEISSTAPAAINASAGTFIFLAIA
jgi:hypothetical protein